MESAILLIKAQCSVQARLGLMRPYLLSIYTKEDENSANR